MTSTRAAPSPNNPRRDTALSMPAWPEGSVALIVTGLKYKRVFPVLVAIAILRAVLLAFYIGRIAIVSSAAQLEPGKVHLQTVIGDNPFGQQVGF